MAGKFEDLRVLAIGAHPDDCEIKVGGAAALWAEQGASVKFLSLTNGDAGHHEMGGGPLARRRKRESVRAAEVLGVQETQTLDNHDGELAPDTEVRKAVVKAIRQWRADVVITCRPNDYHPDHRYTSQVVQDAAYVVRVPNYCQDVPALRKDPAFFYVSDGFTKPCPFEPVVSVDIDPVSGKKLRALHTMDSQMYEWLPWIEGCLEAVPEGDTARLAWLPTFLDGFFEKAEDFRGPLAERYGEERAARVKYSESFELCEYGHRPSRQEVWELFPF
ncbi:PIG-L family deacetylase [bacterium]|nr:PIG-L family deacetylase [bacterium]